MDTIHGPIVQIVTGALVYQVTLSSGMIVTNPSAFGLEDNNCVIPTVIVSEDGKILSAPKANGEIKKTNK